MTVGEVRLAWALLAILAALSYPASSHPSMLALSAIVLAFLLGGLVLSTTTGSARVAEGLEHLLSRPTGRLSLIGAVLLVILVGFAFNAFAAFELTAWFCSLSWSLDMVFRSRAWDEHLTSWTLTGISVFAALAAVEGLLAWEPIARQLGPPAELARWWQGRYDKMAGGGSNLFRFRTRYEDTRRQPGVRRVIALGDSFTWGYRIGPSDSTWPALLEQRLGQPDAPPTEVVNMGVNGFATGNEAEMLRRLGWQFEPDLVIVQWLDNDSRVTAPNFERTDDPKPAVLVPTMYRTGWIRKSGILAMLEDVLTDAFVDYMQDRRSRFAQNAPGWLDAQRAFREMGDSAARRCTPILLVLYPYLFPGRWTEETYPERDIYQLVAETGRSAGLEVLDLLPTFVAAGRGRDWKKWWATAYDGHPGSAAQLITANAIATYIQEHRLLTDRAPTARRCRH